MKNIRIRHQFYLPQDLSEALDRLTAAPGATKSAVLSDALRAWTERRGENELDRRFAARLDRIARGEEKLGERLDLITEALGTFVQHQLTQTAHLPVFAPETARLGQQRFQAFVEAVTRKYVRRDGTGLARVLDAAANNGREA